MKTTGIAALTALFSTGALAVPMAGHNHKAPAHAHLHMRNKRDIIWVTETEIETVVVIKTIYDDAGSPSEPTKISTTSVKPTAVPTTPSVALPASPSESGGSPPPVYTPSTTSSVAPAPTSSTSSYVAPPPQPPSSTTEAPAPTTQAPAPTSYSPEPAPAPTTYAPAPAPQPSSSAPAPAPSPSQSSGGEGGGATFTGDATYWEPAMGACGWTNTASEDVIAISKAIFDLQTPGGNPNNNPLCGKYVAIKCKDGSIVKAKVVDRCVGCASGDLDMTKTLFDKVTSHGDGRVGGMQWSWA